MRGIKFPFGYKFENGEVHIVEEEAEIVRRIFEDRINGVTSPKIGAALYAEKIPYFSDSLYCASLSAVLLEIPLTALNISVS